MPSMERDRERKREGGERERERARARKRNILSLRQTRDPELGGFRRLERGKR